MKTASKKTKAFSSDCCRADITTINNIERCSKCGKICEVIEDWETHHKNYNKVE